MNRAKDSQNIKVMNSRTLHLPEEIRFECTGCGHCCFQWPVPLTPADFTLLKKNADLLGKDSSSLFASLGSIADDRMKAFAYSLEKNKDGFCTFLTADKRCKLHLDQGESSKPSMCRLFPYTFTSTPSGIYASVSFASTGVLRNQGRLLLDQVGFMQEKLDLFTRLFSSVDLNWNGIQLIDGVSLAWSDYLDKEAGILAELLEQIKYFSIEGNKPRSPAVEKSILEKVRIIEDNELPNKDLDRLVDMPATPKSVDWLIINSLLDSYFNPSNQDSAICELDLHPRLARLIERSHSAQQIAGELTLGGKSLRVSNLVKFNLGTLPHQCESLLARFAYCRIFSKLYFGPGFNFLSLIAGLNHLSITLSLARIALKFRLIELGAQRPFSDEDFIFSEFSEIIRQLERRLTVASFSAENTAILEVLLSSRSRSQRIASLAH